MGLDFHTKNVQLLKENSPQQFQRRVRIKFHSYFNIILLGS